MIVIVDATANARLEGVDDFTAFKVRVEPGGESGIGALGRLDDDHVWIGPEMLAQLAGDRSHDAHWTVGLDGMITFAARHGWVDPAGAIRAHIEQSASASGAHRHGERS